MAHDALGGGLVARQQRAHRLRHGLLHQGLLDQVVLQDLDLLLSILLKRHDMLKF